jgi:hypothetical protein
VAWWEGAGAWCGESLSARSAVTCSAAAKSSWWRGGAGASSSSAFLAAGSVASAAAELATSRLARLRSWDGPRWRRGCWGGGGGGCQRGYGWRCGWSWRLSCRWICAFPAWHSRWAVGRSEHLNLWERVYWAMGDYWLLFWTLDLRYFVSPIYL